jgi:alpha-D-xyloside xylohydrolase
MEMKEMNTGDDCVVLNEQGTAARVCLDGMRFQVSRTAAGAWRLQQIVDDRVDEMGAGQLLAAEFDGGAVTDVTELTLDSTGGTCMLKGAKGSTLAVDPSLGVLILLNENGDELTRISGTELKGETRITGSLTDNERLYGTGQRFNKIDQRGKTVSIWAEDKWCHTEGNSYVPIPLVISSGGYAVFMNRFEASEFDLEKSKKNQLTISMLDAPVDLYLFTGPPAEILEQYTALTGRSPVPAYWTFGIHVCRHVRIKEFSTSEGIREMMRQMQTHDLPWHSAIIEGWDAYDPATYTDLKEITDEVHASRRKVLVYQAAGRIWHWLATNSIEFYSKALNAKPEYFVADNEGNIAHPDTRSYNPLDAPCEDSKPHLSSYVDLTDPAAWRWWIETVSDPLHKEIGIDGAKIDFCEQFPESKTLMFYNGASPKGMHHLYPVLFNTKMYQYYNECRPEGGLCFSRGGGIGAQRYPMMWAGDQRREWASLEAILKASLSSGLCGIPFMCHDLGGYIPAEDAEKNREKDVFIRGTQLACFGPNMQTHGTVTRPYDFDEETVAIYRLYSNIHCALMPYLAKQAEVACETGLPLMRHMILEFPDDPCVYDIEDQYMLGDSFLVAPILSDTDSRAVYLPEGEWEPLSGGEPVTGPAMLDTVQAPMQTIPVYVRKTGDRFVEEIVEKIRAIAAS